MNFTGFALRNYRSIGDEWVEINPLKKINILIGKNNSGKSNILKGVELISRLDYKGNKITAELSTTDYHNKNSENQVGLRVTLNGLKKEGIYKEFQEDIYFNIERQMEGGIFKITKYFLSDLNLNQIVRFYNGYFKVNVANVNEQNIDEFVESKSTQFHEILTKNRHIVKLIPEFRQMLSSGNELGLDGKNLIKTIRGWKSPRTDQDSDREKFLRIQKLIRELTHIPNLELDVAGDDNNPELIIVNNNRRLPLESYGTGLHELIILATAVTTLNNCVVCIEEPEIHIHPGLQIEFIKYLDEDDTENIYIISTHSNALIDAAVKPMIFHVRLVNGTTVVNAVENTSDALHAIHDLGVRASDILQTNGVIWVEGPSDEIYISKWLELIDPSLRIGRDYSIMFYGGALLKYTSMERIDDYNELNEFIELLRINQNSYMVMDSDREKAGASKGDAKKRILKECKDNDLGCWLTDEREIENYISRRIFKNMVNKQYGGTLTLKFPPYKKLAEIGYKASNGKQKTLHYVDRKPNFARIIAEYFDAEMFVEKPALKKEIEKLVATIKKWNDITG